MTLIIRNETPADIDAIHALTIAAFRDAPHTAHTEQFIVAALRRAGQLTVSLVALDHDTVIGHVAVSPVTISDGSARWYGLGPIAVAPDRQGGGVGSRLMHEALDALRRLGASGCVVLGDPAYYGRFGFRTEPRVTLPGVPAEYFQIVAFDDKVPSGTVRYHDAFDATA
ncbi:GNAT family N-acetyltransferase [Pandoraea sp. ISTKB]|uniref:GNAT family N-acetyltransferase n=1 Tax=Pandoraea sp. ISTKB TaxID=1586708 RepID=UPI000846FCCE|nr:N-acetyltransferase [Pandoraea sp. ISTKB]ODP35615.1 GCN5 family acetyltransferase [Pandoraea sp. ISTKB]